MAELRHPASSDYDRRAQTTLNTDGLSEKDFEALAVKLDAARAMLAALKDAEKILAQLDDAGHAVHIELRETRAAIAAAKAAGIKAEG